METTSLHTSIRPFFLPRAHPQSIGPSIRGLASTTRMLVEFSWNSVQEFFIETWSDCQLTPLRDVNESLPALPIFIRKFSWAQFGTENVSVPQQSNYFAQIGAIKVTVYARIQIQFCTFFYTVFQLWIKSLQVIKIQFIDCWRVLWISA